MRFSFPVPMIGLATRSLALRSPTARRFALLAFTLAMLGLGGACEDKHIGRLCDPGIPSAMGGTSGGGMSIATVASPALECPSRICIVPGGDTGNPAGTGALCTASCESNDDCDGETGPMGNATDKHCETGFVCMWPTTVGNFKCQKLCVCRDFVSPTAPGITQPPTCK